MRLLAQVQSFFLALLLTSGLADRALAQEGAPPSVRRGYLEGTQAFRRLLGDYGLQPLTDAEQIKEAPERTLLIVLGDLRILRETPYRNLAEFFAAGGAALIATDQPSAHLGLLPALDLHVTGIRLTSSSETDQYRGMSECPILYPVRDGRDPDGLKAKLYSKVTTVATNRPSFLNGWIFPRMSRVEFLAGVRLDRDTGDARYVMAGGVLGQGRLLLSADHSIFINEMLLQRDNDNLYFTLNAIDWLTENGKRDRVLFVDNDRIQTSFDVPLEEPQLPPLPSLNYLVPLMNRTLAGVQEENIIPQILFQLVPPQFLLRWLAIGATLGFVIFLMLQLGRVRQRFDSAEPVLGLVLAQQPPAALALEQRHQSMLAEGNLYDAARNLARQEVVRLLGRPLPPVDQDAPGGIMTPPPLKVQGSWWQRWRWQRRWQTLWQLALGPTPIRTSPWRFRRLSRELQELRTAVAEQRIRIDPPPT